MVLNVTFHAFFIGPDQDRHHGTFGTGWLRFPEVLLGNFVFRKLSVGCFTSSRSLLFICASPVFRVFAQTQGFMQNIIPLVISVIKLDFYKNILSLVS